MSLTEHWQQLPLQSHHLLSTLRAGQGTECPGSNPSKATVNGSCLKTQIKLIPPGILHLLFFLWKIFSFLAQNEPDTTLFPWLPQKLLGTSEHPHLEVMKLWSNSACTWFWKESLRDTQPRPFIYIFSEAALLIKLHSWAFTTDTMWSASLKYLHSGPLQKQLANLCPSSVFSETNLRCRKIQCHNHFCWNI